MAKRKKRKAAANRQSGVAGVVNLPGGRKAEIIREGDPEGRAVVHPRTVDTLGKMRRSGSITPSMHDAALDTLRGASLVKISGGGHAADLTDRQVAAREKVLRAMDVLGGINSPAGSCVWYVVGLEHSIRQWAMRQGWSGRTVHISQAPGMLVAALGMLAAHYGYKQPHQKLGD
jgi:hypothetical protein